MKRILRAIAALVCIMILSGCTQDQPPTEPAVQPDPAALYQSALDALDPDSYRLQIDRTVELGEDVYRESSDCAVQLSGMGTQAFAASVDKTLRYGEYTVQLRDSYAGGTRFVELNGSRFKSEETGDAFLARLAPAALLQPGNYKTVTATAGTGEVRIDFSDAIRPEQWLNIPQITEASGYAQIAADGTLTQSCYLVTYNAGNARITCRYRVTPMEASGISQVEPDAYLPIACADAPGLLEAATGYLSQAGNVSSTITEQLVSQAAGLTRDRESRIRMAGNGKFLALLEHRICLTDGNRGGVTTEASHRELHKNGHYTLDGQISSSSFTAGQMRSYIAGLLVEHILLPQYMTDVTVTEADGIRLLEFSCSEELARVLVQRTARELLEDETVLDALADSYRTESVRAHLQTDIATGLPLSAGIRFAGEHTIGGYRYGISYQLEQSFCLADSTLRDAILSE